jgi:serine/threonine protein kinase
MIWFLLVDSDGLPYKRTTADFVSLPSAAVVAQVRDAVKAKRTNKLSLVDAADLLVYKNKVAFDKRNATVDEGKGEPLKPSRTLDGLGETEEEALIIVVPSSMEKANASSDVAAVQASKPSPTSVPDKLKQLGVKFRTRDIKYLLNNDTAKYSLLKSPELTSVEAQAILTYATSKIQSATQKTIGLQHSFFLDGSLNVGHGQTKSSLYYAFSESGGVFVAKVYHQHKDDFTREVETNQALDHKNLVKFVKTFSMEDNVRHIIIMPLFPRSVADWLLQHHTVPLVANRVIARNCFDALCHLHSKSFCFADLKPSNIMLQNTEPGYATLVDYGATVQIGSSIIEFTKQYCLDADTVTATEHLDWICLGTTLAEMGGFRIFNYDRTIDLVHEVLASTQEDCFKKLIVSCLQRPSSSKIESALHQLECVNLNSKG